MSVPLTPQTPPPPRQTGRRLPDGPLPPDHALETALVGLVADGTLSEDQARAVRAARAGAAEAEARVPASAEGGRRRSPLPEILGYAGAALLASATLNLVANRWESWPEGVRIGLLAGAAVALWVAGVTVMLLGGGHRALDTPEHDNRRRLVATLLALSVPCAGLATLQAAEAAVGPLPDASPWLLASGLVALAVAAVAAALVRGVMITLGVAVGLFWSAQAAAAVVLPEDPVTWVWPVGVAAVGIAWLLLAPRLLAAPRLSEALGMAWLVVGLFPVALRPVAEAEMDLPGEVVAAAWVARGLLVVMAVVCLLAFVRGAHWPYAAGGVAAGVLAAMTIGGGAFGWIAGMFVAGVVMLGLSAVLVVVRRRSARAPAATG